MVWQLLVDQARNRQVIPIVMQIITVDLTPRQRQVMALYVLDQKTQVETAEELGVIRCPQQHANEGSTHIPWQ